MTRLLTALRWEAVLQARNQFYAVTAVVAAVWIGLLFLLPEAARTDPAALAPAFIALNLQVTAFFFAAALVLLEKGQGTVSALVVSPLRPGEYVSAKGLSLAVLATVENAAIVAVVFGLDLRWGWLLLGTCALALVYAFVGLIAVARFDTINRFLFPSMLYIAFLGLPLLGYYEVVPRWIFAVHPVWPPLVLLEAGCTDVSAGSLMYGIVGSVVWTGLTFAWARRRFVRDVVPTAA